MSDGNDQGQQRELVREESGGSGTFEEWWDGNRDRMIYDTDPRRHCEAAWNVASIKPTVKAFEALLPAYKVSLDIKHNNHRGYYEKLSDKIESLRLLGVMDEKDLTPEEEAECIATDSFWEMCFFPSTPVGSCHLFAPTLEKLMAKLDSDDRRPR
jgi:hypothetical protein